MPPKKEYEIDVTKSFDELSPEELEELEKFKKDLVKDIQTGMQKSLDLSGVKGTIYNMKIVDE